ncbi:MAG: hypothetical protein DMF24_13080, partial [Verrucomicrobia bacterium]
ADPESLRRIAHSRAPFSTWLGIVLLFALFGVIVLAVVGPSPRRSDYEETRSKKRVENLKKLREETEKDLTTYAWVDKNKGVARIPITRAMELAVAELVQKKPGPAGPIATPATQTSPASPAPASPTSAGSQQPSAAQSSQAPASPSPAAQSSPPALASPPPNKTP